MIAPLTEELVFRACMLPMLAPCTGLGPAVFTCPLFFGVGEFVQPGPTEMFLAWEPRMGFGARAGPIGQAGRNVMWFSSSSAHFHHIFEQLRFRQSSVGSIFLSAGES